MFISVIIPTCHRNDLLAKCLDLLAPGRQTLAAEHYEVIVTDDGSFSTAREMIQRQYSWAKWITGQRKGPAANRNNGAMFARGEWLVFTDDDCLPEKQWLATYAAAIQANKVEVLEGRTSPEGKQTRVDMECPANETGGYLWSCNMAVKRDLFLTMGGFDTGFPGAIMEDVEFRTRLLKLGKKFVFVPTALVWHPWRLKKGTAFVTMYAASRCYYLKRHPEEIGSLTVKAIVWSLARRLIKQIPREAWQCGGQGLIRDLGLTFFTAYVLVAASRRMAR